MRTGDRRKLSRLARLYGVQPAYRDTEGRVRPASVDALRGVLEALGVDPDSAVDAAVQRRRRELGRRVLEPVVVQWSGGGVPVRGIEEPGVRLRLPDATPLLRTVLHLEDGPSRTWEGSPEELAGARPVRIEGERWITGWLPLPADLPDGYHRLVLDAGTETREALVIQAPRRAWDPTDGAGDAAGRGWGVFAPLHAVRRREDGDAGAARFGVGTYRDLADLATWIAGVGGRMVATLPLLATFLDRPLEPSPYAPVSRRFWNELYVDVARLPELEDCEEARAAMESGDVREADRALEAADTVDYRRAAAAKRRVMEPLARRFFDAGGDRGDAYRAFLETAPDAEMYARFRTMVEQYGTDRSAWPKRSRSGEIHHDDVDGDVVRYHLYAQFAAGRDLAAAADAAAAAGVGLALDLPLGVYAGGFDTWREGALFAAGVAAGAPPDAFFEGGQNWGSPPIRPDRSRERGHAHLRDCVRHHMRHAAALRVDHIMGLHRLFWIPDGADARDGTYVSYPAEELYAILNLESHRSRTAVIGEDLGTVPGRVRWSMDQHGVRRSYVAQFEAHPDPDAALGAVPEGAMATVDTHDTPTFAAWWHGRDIRERADRGALAADRAAEEEAHRAAIRDALNAYLAREGLADEDADGAGRSTLRALLRYLARSDAFTVVVALEDLWLETEPQNRPGLAGGQSWRRRMRRTLEQALEARDVLGPLKEIDRLRRQ